MDSAFRTFQNSIRAVQGERRKSSQHIDLHDGCRRRRHRAIAGYFRRIRSQQENEPVEAFITDLFNLAEHCNFGYLREELIRDRIVVGIRDKNLSEKLQLESDLTLEKAVNLFLQRETVRKQQEFLNAEEKFIGYVKKMKGKPWSSTRKPKD